MASGPPSPGAIYIKGDSVAQEFPTEVVIIQVGEVDRYTPGDYAHFKDASGKAWNVGNELADCLPNPNAQGVNVYFAEGNRIKVRYETHPGVNGRRPSRWIKKVVLTDEPLTAGYEPKPAWRPSAGGGSKSNGGFKSNGEFRTPEQIMRGQALEIAEGDIEKAKELYAWILGDFEAKVAEVAEAFDATVEPDDDIPF